MIPRWLSGGGVLAVWLAVVGCKSSEVDGNDLRGVFDKTAAAPTGSASGSAAASPPPAPTSKPSASAPVVASRRRAPVKGPCIAEEGEPAERNKRVGKRPACRRSRVLEHREADGTPRYGCVFESTKIEDTKPLPLVVFLHGEYDGPTAVHKKTRLRARYHKIDLTGDPKHPGFVILAPQARKLAKSPSLRWDHEYRSLDNVDIQLIDRFVDELLEAGLVDARQVYVVGESAGGKMAALYSMLRPDRVAAFGVYGTDASSFDWTCAGTAPPAAVIYRACDAEVPCADVESWLSARENARAPTFSLRLGSGKATEPSCALSKSACRPKKGKANHQRWPKYREQELLEFLGRYSLEGEVVP